MNDAAEKITTKLATVILWLHRWDPRRPSLYYLSTFLAIFWPINYVSMNWTSAEVAIFLTPPTQFLCWRNIGMVSSQSFVLKCNGIPLDHNLCYITLHICKHCKRITDSGAPECQKYWWVYVVGIIGSPLIGIGLTLSAKNLGETSPLRPHMFWRSWFNWLQVNCRAARAEWSGAINLADDGRSIIVWKWGCFRPIFHPQLRNVKVKEIYWGLKNFPLLSWAANMA